MVPRRGPNAPPDRVLVESGLATDAKKALAQHGMRPTVVFLRKDGWALGAPGELEREAYMMWKDEWTHFARTPFRVWHPISKYGGP